MAAWQEMASGSLVHSKRHSRNASSRSRSTSTAPWRRSSTTSGSRPKSARCCSSSPASRAWAGGNEATATRLARMSVDESGMGSPEPKRRAKVLGILRDALRQKSIGIIEEMPEKGIVKYAKPAGIIASLIPVTSPYVTPIGIAIYAIKCKDAVLFSPHPGSKQTTNETVRIMRAALSKLGAPEDLLQCVQRPSIPLANELMATAGVPVATGGPPSVRPAYSPGKPAY